MKKSAIWLAALCACALLLAGVAMNAAPQSNANVAGAWTITLAPPPAGGGGGGGGGGAPPPGGGGGGGQGRGPGGPIVVTFKQDGAKLTGTMPGRGGADVALEGTVSGNTVTWTVKTQGRDGSDITTTYKATVDGDNMKGTRTSSFANSTPRDFTATKNK